MGMTDKERFEQLVKLNIKRKGIDKIMEMLENSDFYTAPASTRFHDSEVGGLVKHSLNVFDELFTIKKQRRLDYSDETIALVSLFHDICKVGMYESTMRNVKRDNKWTQEPYYTINNLLPLGHGEKSVIMLMESMKLEDYEMFAINAHMGGFDKREYVIGETFEICPLAVELHVADLRASYGKK